MHLTFTHALLRAAAVLMLSIPSAHAADYKPAIEFASMLDMRFYEDDGSFMVDKLQLVFPPEGVEEIGFVIVDADNKVAASSRLRVEKWEEFPAFDGLRAIGPGFVKLQKPGKYTMAFRAGNQFLTTYPFTLHLYEGGDAMNPIRKWYLDGYWPNLAYFSRPTDEPDAQLKFSWWTSQRDVPGGGKGAKCTIHLVRDGQEIANGGSPVIISSNQWTSFSRSLLAGNQHFNLSMLTQRDGDYSVDVKMNGATVKSYALTVRDGKVEPLKFSQLGYEPSTSFVAPRRIDTSSRSGSSYEMLDLWWVTRK